MENGRASVQNSMPCDQHAVSFLNHSCATLLYVCSCLCTPGLKPSWVIGITYSQLRGSTRPDPDYDLTLTALSEYFNLLADTENVYIELFFIVQLV